MEQARELAVKMQIEDDPAFTKLIGDLDVRLVYKDRKKKGRGEYATMPEIATLYYKGLCAKFADKVGNIQSPWVSITLASEASASAPNRSKPFNHEMKCDASVLERSGFGIGAMVELRGVVLNASNETPFKITMIDDNRVTLSYIARKENGTDEEKTMTVDNAKFLDEYKSRVTENEELR